MTHDREEAGEGALDGVDLHAWRVPPPAAVERSALFGRALTPVTGAARRPRLAWIIAAIVIANAAIATIIVILVAPRAERVVAVQPAGGGGGDARVRELQLALTEAGRELERKVAELARLRAEIAELEARVRAAEAAEELVEPATCDEVFCVLDNYRAPCCAKFRKPRRPAAMATPLPESLDRDDIRKGVAAVTGRVRACGTHSDTPGIVKVKVRVHASGRPVHVSVTESPDPALTACVSEAMQRAVFRQTQQGGSFVYPFRF